ncbi:hypothetical protein [Amphritea sp. HPY]|uniref:hypothetical protein n=1 Tax=Amphritea sp. HPY TaxID=3421652 RepID=UPI003D7DCD9B
MFYELECHACNATGVLNRETGEQVEQGAVIRAMRKHIRKLNAQIEQLKKHQPEFDPYGELKDKNGGKYRGD